MALSWSPECLGINHELGNKPLIVISVINESNFDLISKVFFDPNPGFLGFELFGGRKLPSNLDLFLDWYSQSHHEAVSIYYYYGLLLWVIIKGTFIDLIIM